MINFPSMPSNLRVPIFAAEFDASRASQGPALLAYRGLIIGQKIAAGSAADNSLHKVTSADQVQTLAGRGSQLHRQAVAWFANNKSTELWIGVLADNGAGVAATGTIVFADTATAAGTLCLYIAGQRLTVAVASGTAAAAVATAVAAAINAQTDLPVTAAAATATVTLTARNRGSAGNDIDVRVNYQAGEFLPAGITATITAMASGATNPTLTALLAAMGDNWYHVVAHPYTDATSLSALEAEFLSRAGPLRMIDGLLVTSASGTNATLGTLGDGRNSPYSVIAAQPGEKPVTPPAEFAAAVAAVVAYHAAIDPSRPFQTLTVQGVKAPADADLFTLQERNLMLFDGVATTRTAADGTVQLERVITTYKTNAAGADDVAYLDANTPLTLMYLRYSLRTRFLNAYPRHKLADDGARVGPGQAVITPKIAKAEVLGWFRECEGLGLVENFEAFAADLVVERNAQDRNRLDFLVPPDLMNQFVVGAANLQFRL